jgi:hypothetical protein
MTDKFLTLFKSATSFLQNGVAPPNTPEAQRQALEEQNHFASKKFFIVFTAAILLAFFYFSSILILFVLPKDATVVTGYVTMFTKSIEILGVIIAFYTTGQAVVDLRYNSMSNAGVQGNAEVDIEQITENLTHNAKDEDYEIDLQ